MIQAEEVARARLLMGLVLRRLLGGVTLAAWRNNQVYGYGWRRWPRVITMSKAYCLFLIVLSQSVTMRRAVSVKCRSHHLNGLSSDLRHGGDHRGEKFDDPGDVIRVVNSSARQC